MPAGRSKAATLRRVIGRAAMDGESVWGRCSGRSRWCVRLAAVSLAFLAVACVQGRPAADVSDPGFPFGPTSLSVKPLAYVQDIKPIFDRDCLECHNSRDARGEYSVSTFADTMRRQRPGDAKSSVVVDCAPGGSMYRYFRGDATAAATMVFRWMVYYDGAETR
jgi:hypothetical protein